MGDEYINNSTINPSQDKLDICEYFNDVQDFRDIYTALWNEVKMAK